MSDRLLVPIPLHECNAYCGDGLHCFPEHVIAIKGTWKDLTLEAAQSLFGAKSYGAVRQFQRAPEADDPERVQRGLEAMGEQDRCEYVGAYLVWHEEVLEEITAGELEEWRSRREVPA